ncbi:hypothetical protein [Paralcaligenes ureilyticus]|uniref:Uncharacterized protein n=1 Tax=Paralcaligenes ureilyticus TaxID=627131 RepID=A0A4R3MD91_9BURK|nr:hypothetical protein [Paralcaligenes ureilyticus]TCT09485.1 hypothetical protein EDC26_103103 [Paralcaligenes ureilyticus]
MGLLDTLSAQTPQGDALRQGLLGMGAGLLSGSRGSYGAFAPALGNGIAGFQDAQMKTQQLGMMQRYREAMAAQAMQNVSKSRALQNFLTSRFGGATPAASAVASPVAVGGGLLSSGASPAMNSTLPLTGITSHANSFPLDLNDVTMIKALGGPDLFNQYKYATDGVEQKSGSYYKDPMTGQVKYYPAVDKGITMVDGNAQAVPGYATANAAIQGSQTDAQEAAKARHTVVSVPTAGGGSVMLPQDQAVDRLRSPIPPVSLGGNGASGGFGVQQSPADAAYAQSIAKGAAAQYNSVQTAAQNASGQIASYQRLGSLLDGYQGGSLSNVGVQAGKLANSLGWHDFDPKLPDKEAAMAIGNQLALQLRSTGTGSGMPGSMSDADRNFLVASTPNLAQTDEGRKKLIDYQTKVLKRQQDVGTMARKWQAQYGRLDARDAQGNDFQTSLQSWADKNPLFSSGKSNFSTLWGG